MSSREFVVNGVPTRASSPREAATSLYPGSRLYGSTTDSGRSLSTTWRTPEGLLFLVEDLSPASDS